MNMLRIRRIMEMRKDAKAPPLLPPKIKKDNDRSFTPREIVVFSLRISEVRVALNPASTFFIQVYEEKENKWTLMSSSDWYPSHPTVDLPSLFSLPFLFPSHQLLRIQLSSSSSSSVLPIASQVFRASQAVLNRSIDLPLVDESGGVICRATVHTDLKPRPPSLLIQIEGEFGRRSDAMCLVVSDLNGQEIYRSEWVKSEGKKCSWKPFTLTREDEDERQMQLSVVYKEERSKMEVVLGNSIVNTSQLLREGTEVQLWNDAKEKVVGSVNVAKQSFISIPSFTQLLSEGVSLHLSIAIDFSSPLEESYPSSFFSDVEFAVRSIGDACSQLTGPDISSYGFGAKIPPLGRESHEFCLSLDTSASIESVDRLIDTFHSTSSLVLPLQAPRLSHVIYYVSKMAQKANSRNDRPMKYFVLVILTRGAMEDVKETVQAVIYASKTPLSIIFVGIGDEDKEDLDRLGNGGTRLIFQGRRAVRDLLQYVDIRSIDRSNVSSLSHAALQRVPSQVIHYSTRCTSRSTTPTPHSSRPFSMNSVDVPSSYDHLPSTSRNDSSRRSSSNSIQEEIEEFDGFPMYGGEVTRMSYPPMHQLTLDDGRRARRILPQTE